MPYIAIKGYPKDAETYKSVVDKINEVLVSEWGCPPQAISISVEAIAPDKWEETVGPELAEKADKMMIQNGEKKY